MGLNRIQWGILCIKTKLRSNIGQVNFTSYNNNLLVNSFPCVCVVMKKQQQQELFVDHILFVTEIDNPLK